MELRRFKTATITLLLATLAAACGGEGAAERVVEVSMTDNSFDPASVSVVAGETVTFRFTNNGAVPHDAFIGDAAAQHEHGESMRMGGDMDDYHMQDGASLHLERGQSGELTYTFDEAGEVFIGCHQPGHYEGGMKSTITVS